MNYPERAYLRKLLSGAWIELDRFTQDKEGKIVMEIETHITACDFIDKALNYINELENETK